MEVQACRVCLTTETQLHSFSENNVKTAFQDIIGFRINLNSGLPKHICNLCKARILQFAEFRKWCRNIQDLLNTKLADNIQITKDVLQEVTELCKFPKTETTETLIQYANTCKDEVFEDHSDQYEEEEHNEDGATNILPLTITDTELSVIKPEVDPKSVETDKKLSGTAVQIKTELNKNLRNGFKFKKLPQKTEETFKLANKSVPVESCDTIVKKASTVKATAKRNIDCENVQLQKSKSTIDYELLTAITRIVKKNENSLKPIFVGNVIKKFPRKERKLIGEEVKVKVTKSKCTICKHVFLNQKALQRHNLKCCKASGSPCGLCGAGFPDSTKLFAHMTAEHKIKDTKKRVTGKRPMASKESHLDRQKSEVHGKEAGQQPAEEGYVCEHCGKHMQNHTVLRLHMTGHTGEKPYKCDICQKRFRVKYSLQVHELIHSDKKPFKCTVCSTRFRHSSHVTRHMRTHTGEKPYTCDVCKRAFACKSNMAEHIRMVHEGLPSKYRKKTNE